MINFQKLQLIIKREFVTRVRTKGFIISTLLAPLGLILIFAIPIGLQMMDSDTEPVIAVVDNRGGVVPILLKNNPGRYSDMTGTDDAELRAAVLSDTFQGLLIIPSDAKDAKLDFFYAKGGLDLTRDVQNDARAALKEVRINDFQIDEASKELLLSNPGFETRKLSDQGESEGNEGFMFLLGNLLGFFIYFAIFIYGALVMRGVIEEKSSRIMEVIASSVKPFELLLGKIIGVGSVGLLQFVSWTLLSNGILLVIAPIAAALTKKPVDSSGLEQAAASGGFQVPEIEIWVWIAFVGFFLAGYLMYSAMFAAIGSAVDNEQDAQQLQFPVTIPVIIPILLVGKVIADPNSNFAVISSMIPLFSPILMMVRLAITDVPFWQWGTSILLMTVTFLGLVWIAARIYRVGILMYGKKPTMKELAKWVMMP